MWPRRDPFRGDHGNVRRYASALIWIAYVVVPVRAGGLIHGVPLGAWDAAALIAIVWLTARGQPSAAGRSSEPLSSRDPAAALIPAERGFRARYFANDAAQPPFERSPSIRAAISRASTRASSSRRADPSCRWGSSTTSPVSISAAPAIRISVCWRSRSVGTDSGGGRGRRPARLFLDAPGASAELIVDASQVPVDRSRDPPERPW